MVRTVKAKAVRPLIKGESAVLLPGGTGAESWEVWVMGTPPVARRVQSCATPRDNQLRKTSTLALPVAQVFCLPLWLNETNSKQLAGMIQLQLEMRGLQPRGSAPAVFDWTIVSQEETRTLVMVGVLPSSLANEIQVQTYGSFDLSARYYTFAENSLTLWQEQEAWALAITLGRNLVYFQTLTVGPLTARTIQDLNCVRATLVMQGILVSLQQVILWSEVTPEELSLLQAACQAPIRQMERPSPTQPSSPWKLIPPTIGEAKRSREIQRWQMRGLSIALVVYLVLVAFILAQFLLISHKIALLRQWQSDHAQTVELVRDTRTAWKELGPVVDESQYPLELLFHASDAIPADDLHLTLFEASPGHLLIKGEAKNVAAAFQFLDKLKADENFSDYSWDMSQPHLLPNDLAQLQIEGTRAPAN